MVPRRRAVSSTTVTLSAIIAVLVGSLVSVAVAPLLATPVTATQTMTTGLATRRNTDSMCHAAGSLPGLPAPTAPWFTAVVNYSGPWEALAVVYDSRSPILTACYTGNGQGFFIIQNPSFTGTSTIQVTAAKLDGGTGTLNAAVNGDINSTALPYGSATVSAPVDNAGAG